MTASRPARLPHRGRLVVTAVLLAAIAAIDLDAAVSGPRDTTSDLTGLLRGAAEQVASFSPVVIAVLLGVSVVHYLCAAVAARAAAGTPLPLGETVAVTLVSAAVNRVTLGGVGGALVMGRFLTRRGSLPASQAAVAVTALALIGGLSDLAAFSVLVVVCVAISAPHTGGAAASLATKWVHAVPGSTGGGLLIIGVAAAVGIAGLWAVRRWRLVSRLRRLEVDYRVALVDLARSPRRLGVLCLASGATTAALAAGFAGAAVLGPTGLPAADAGALMIGYMVSAAAGNAFPTPSGVGAADAAFVAVLTGLGAPLGQAVTVVLAFRVITFWLPAGVGVVLAPGLRRARAV